MSKGLLLGSTALTFAVLFAPAVEGDPTLTLDYNHLLDSGSTIAQSVVTGPTPTFARASNARAVDSAGLLSNVTTDNPRFAHDPADGNAKLGLLEENKAATNLQIRSAEFNNVEWTIENVTIDADAAVGPDGNTVMDRLNVTAGGPAKHDVFGNEITITADVDYCASAFMKADGAGFGFITWWGQSANSITAVMDLSTGVITSTRVSGSATLSASGSIDIGGGVHRIWIAGIAGAADTSVQLIIGASGSGTPSWSSGRPDYIGVAGEDLFVWGAQLELGSFPTSHIPTTTASATRAKDIRTLTDLSWLNANAGTMFKQGIIPHVSAAERTLWVIDDNTNTNLMRLYLDAAENGNFETVNSGDTDGASDGAAVIAVDTVFKLAGTYEDDSVIGYVDGTASAEDTTAGIPVTGAAQASRWGNDGATLTPANMYTQKERYWNVVKSAAFVSAL